MSPAPVCVVNRLINRARTHHPNLQTNHVCYVGCICEEVAAEFIVEPAYESRIEVVVRMK